MSGLSKKLHSASVGYTLIEVLVAAALLAIGVAAVASLALAMAAQEEGNARISRALNSQEQAARLYQLGLTSTEITALLPVEPNVTSLSFTATTSTVSGVGDIEIAACRMIFHAGTPITSDLSPSLRTNDIVVVRPSIR